MRFIGFNEYQIKARSTAIYPDLGHNFVYPTLGLCGEAGEVAEKVKKVLRDDNGTILNEKMLEIEKELGDVLWYLANICSELGLTLEGIARLNLQKLQERTKDNTIHGSGDNR